VIIKGGGERGKESEEGFEEEGGGERDSLKQALLGAPHL